MQSNSDVKEFAVPEGQNTAPSQSNVNLVNGQGPSVQMDQVLNEILPPCSSNVVNSIQTPLSSSLIGKEVNFDMQVDTQFPNIFRERGIRQPFSMFHIKTNIDAKAS